MTSPLTNADSLRIGSVDFVSPDEIKVLLDIEAPNDVALNAILKHKIEYRNISDITENDIDSMLLDKNKPFKTYNP